MWTKKWMNDDAVKTKVALLMQADLITFQSGTPGIKKLSPKIIAMMTSGLNTTKNLGRLVALITTKIKAVTESTKYEISIMKATGNKNVFAKSLIMLMRFPAISETKIFHIYMLIVKITWQAATTETKVKRLHL